MYYVYRRTGRGASLSWQYHSEHIQREDAEEAAIGLVPKGSELATEPSSELDRAYFGAAHQSTWSSWITCKKVA